MSCHPWMPEPENLVYTEAFDFYKLAQCCVNYRYQYPSVGVCVVPKSAWCRNLGKVCAHLTLKGTSSQKHFGIITGVTTYGDTVEEAVNKLVQQAIEFIHWRADHLKLYG
nr:envelope protein [Grimso virus]